MPSYFDNYFAILEGGYNTDILPDCINGFLDGINGKEYQGDSMHTDSEILVHNEHEMRLHNLISHLKPYWEL